MSSRAVEYPRASAALAGLGLTTQLAAAATDSIPIAKLVLGVVSRIVTLASDIEKSRDALHQLAADARKMGDKIPAVVSGRQLGPEIQRSLEEIYEVLRSIESVFKKHKAKNAFHKALSYAFTTSKRIGGLSQELSRATQELLWVSVVDTNAEVRENSRCIGEFRRIRLCDVDELRLMTERAIYWTGYTSRIYSGKVMGRVVVLRSFERNSHVGPDGKAYEQEWLRQEIIEHDQLLEKLSTDPSLHRNIARLYGRNSREHFDRFNVMNSDGSRISQFDEHPATIDSTWSTVSQLVVSGPTTMTEVAEGSGQDAAIWLEDKGLAWYPESCDAVFIDSSGSPIVGLHNDLRRLDAKRWHIVVLRLMVEHAYSAHWEDSRPSKHALDISFATALEPKGIHRQTITVPRRLIPTLDAKISTYITNALRSLRDPFELWAQTGAVVLHAAACGCNVGSTFYTEYTANLCKRTFEDNIYSAQCLLLCVVVGTTEDKTQTSSSGTGRRRCLWHIGLGSPRGSLPAGSCSSSSPAPAPTSSKTQNQAFSEISIYFCRECCALSRGILQKRHFAWLASYG